MLKDFARLLRDARRIPALWFIMGLLNVPVVKLGAYLEDPFMVGLGIVSGTACLMAGFTSTDSRRN